MSADVLDRPTSFGSIGGAVSVDVPRVEWSTFAAQLDWRQGEHVALVAPTGQGKTTLALALADYRLERGGHVALTGTKPADPTLAGLKRHGWQVVGEWGDKGPGRRVVVWPKWRDDRDTPRQQAALARMYRGIFRVGRWCVMPDDLQYQTQRLRLGTLLSDLWVQGRSVGVSIVGATQRPVKAPRELFTQSSHYFLWGTGDDEDIRSLAGLGMADTKLVRRTVAALPRHDVLYVDGRNPGVLCITRAPRPGGN